MFPHVAEALDIVRARARHREAKQVHAHRIYARSLLLGELPLGGANALADAAEELALSPDDFRIDAELALAAQKLNEELSQLHEQSKSAVAAAKAEDSRWHPDADVDDFPSAGRAILSADRTLRENQTRVEVIRNQLRRLHDRSSRLFSQEIRNLMQPPAKEIPVAPQVLRFNSGDEDDEIIGDTEHQAQDHTQAQSNQRGNQIPVMFPQQSPTTPPPITPEAWS